MDNTDFNTQLRQIVAAISASRESFAARNAKIKQTEENTEAHLSAIESVASENRRWATEQMAGLAAIIKEGTSHLPESIDLRYSPQSPTPVGDPKQGLPASAKKAGIHVAGIREGGRELLLWKARRASIMTGLGIAALALVVVVGLGIFWVVSQQRNESAAATQTIEAVTSAPTRTAAAATGSAAAAKTETAIAATATAKTGNGADGTRDDRLTETPEGTNTIEATSRPPTNTPRPPATAGPTPTSLPPGAACPGALPTRLTVGGKARVINYQLNVRSGPGTNNSVVRRLDPGRMVDILEGPVCDDGQLWYRIISEEVVPRDGSQPYRAEGWLVEESGGTYYLEPIQ